MERNLLLVMAVVVVAVIVHPRGRGLTDSVIVKPFEL